MFGARPLADDCLRSTLLEDALLWKHLGELGRVVPGGNGRRRAVTGIQRRSPSHRTARRAGPDPLEPRLEGPQNISVSGYLRILHVHLGICVSSGRFA